MRNSTPFFAAFAPLLFGRPPRSFRTALRQSVLKTDSLSQWRAAFASMIPDSLLAPKKKGTGSRAFNYPQVEARKLQSAAKMSVQIETLLMQSLGWEPRKTSASEGLGTRRTVFRKEETKHGLIGNVQSATLRMCACRSDLGSSSNRCLEGSVRAFRLSARIGRTRRRHIDSYPIGV